MSAEMDNLSNTFNDLIIEHNTGIMFESDDSMISWKARCDWFIKQMVDIKVGAGFEYFRLQREYNPLQENDKVGEGEETE
ncbi:hypothetical protein ACQKNX_07720 [Lysinibacillus sp. NPDC093712]|uniref:hypothetical protein n=1 Tax=Lysinibacillus sp. NPDC093712 TaxID=3390579 RepID=UPI003CFDDC5A